MTDPKSNPAPLQQLLFGALGGVVFCLAVAPASAQPPQYHPAPVERRNPAPQAAPYQGSPYPNQRPYPQNDPQHQPAGNFSANQARPVPSSPGRPGQTQHLAGWMDAHRNLTPAQQHSALESEPGFRQLNPQEQQRMHQRLNQLNNMPPEQQQRVIARTEALERLPPAQRQQFRGAMAKLGSLPEDRRRAVARTYRSLSTMPESQRQSYLNSPEYRSQFNEQERGTMTNLLNVAPMIPPRQQP